MANLLTLPAELRLHVYEALVIQEPRCTRLGPTKSGPVLCYTSYTFHAAILGVNKLIGKEATRFLYEGNPCMIYVYLVFHGDSACGSDVDGGLGAALETLSTSVLFPHVHTCIIDIRLFCGARSGVCIPNLSTFGELHTSVEAICGTVSQSPALKTVEVSWSDYFHDHLREQKRKSLQPLGKLPTMFTVRNRVVEKTEERSETDFSDWPNMLKPYRRLDFCHSSFNENDDVESAVFRPPHPSDIDVLGAESH